MAYSEDLVYQRARAGERVIIPRLSGHRCARCGEQLYDAASTRIIGEHVDVAGPRGGYELRITGLSKGKIGFYLKEDVVREMRLAKGQGFLAIPLTRDTMLLERRSAVDAAEAWLRETRAKRKPRPRDAPRAEDLIRAARDAR